MRARRSSRPQVARRLALALTLAVLAILAFTSSALAELTVNEEFEYDSPGMTFEAQHVGPTHCKAKYQVNPKKFPATENETTLGTPGPGGGREVITCKSTNKKPIEGTVAPGESFPRLNPASDYWVSEWFLNFNPGQSCYVMSLPLDRAKGKMSLNGKSLHIVVYLEYDRECHARG
jgi:hypothetical protein